MHTGLYRRRFPCRDWRIDEYRYWLCTGIFHDPKNLFESWRSQGPQHFVPHDDPGIFSKILGELASPKALNRLVAEADALRRGRFTYFFKEMGDIGFPPDWRLNPFTGGRVSSRVHWSRIPVHSKEFGDIKYIWEPARFAAAYTLARAYKATNKEVYAECFWELVESWGDANPPNQGPHWRCGQEISLRLMAWAFALHVFRDSPSTTPERFVRLLGMIAVQADRVAGTTLYAHLQDNNHSISEGAGLWTVGVLFPMLAGATAWRRKGRIILEMEAGRLIHEDGSFSQKSNNYHRLMLHDYLYALRLGEVNGYMLDSKTTKRIEKASDFLLGMIDPFSGWAPNLGGNDGALILPLNSCDYNDMRPVTAATHYYISRERIFESGPWHEDLYWLFGSEALNNQPRQPSISKLSASEGGYYTLRRRESWAMLRCGPYLTRPSQPDSLHLDLWWRGRNIAIDPGTYLYYAEPPWNNGLESTRLHNTVCVDGLDQLEQGPRFMWLRWHDAKLIWRGTKGSLSCLEGEHNGYERLDQPVRHRRSVLCAGEAAWIVIDDLSGEGQHEFSLQWLIAQTEKAADGSFQRLGYPEGPVWFKSLVLDPPKDSQIVADWLEHPVETEVRGWYSRYYGVREPALSHRLCIRGHPPIRFLTVFSFLPWRHVVTSAQQVMLEGDNNCLKIWLQPLGSETLLGKAELSFAGKEATLTRF